MYIIKNALRCIGRSKGRNILIGVIVLVIATSACIGLSIRQAADSTKEETLAGLSVTATISYDRQSMMSSLKEQAPSEEGGSMKFDKDQFASMMGESSSLTLEEYQKYAGASSVKDFYYSLTVMINGSDSFEPVSSETSDSSESESDSSGTDIADSNSGFGGGSFGGGKFGGMDMNFISSDFQIVGYSGENAMTSFIDGTASVTDGSVFTEGTSEYDCIISSELAAYNSISAGDTVTVTNPNSEDETYTLTVVGIYTSSSANEENMFSMGGMTSSDPANQIYMSHAALNSILNVSESLSETVTDETTGRESETKMNGTLSATYVFADTEDYYKFEEEVRTLGLDESYTVTSSDLTSYENSLVPLNTLSTMAGWFLIVILIIGAIILIVLNIFNVRERKYEIGVLTAMGMKKGKVAMQFLTEIFVVTIIAVILGGTIGAVTSVPVTNVLLENQVESQNSQESQVETNFGRENMSAENIQKGGMPGGSSDGLGGGRAGAGGNNPFANMFGGSSENNYVTEISSAMNLTVVLQLLGIAVLLTLVAGAVSMLLVMRYEPLKILANRD